MKNIVIALVLIALSGVFFAVHETINYHYASFKAAFPDANDGYWNPAVSWMNKYKGGDVSKGAAFTGSTTFLVFLTDGKHLTWTVHFLILVCGCSLLIRGAMKKYGATVSNVYIYFMYVSTTWGIHGLSFELIYYFYF